ncbi:hypothetical protein Tco_0463990, partial [Tanacetum coccineum]
ASSIDARSNVASSIDASSIVARSNVASLIDASSIVASSIDASSIDARSNVASSNEKKFHSVDGASSIDLVRTKHPTRSIFAKMMLDSLLLSDHKQIT